RFSQIADVELLARADADEETAGDVETRDPAGQFAHPVHAAAVAARRDADASREERAEGAEAGEADVHADVGDRSGVRGEQLAGPLEADAHQVLVRGGAEGV